MTIKVIYAIGIFQLYGMKLVRSLARKLSSPGVVEVVEMLKRTSFMKMNILVTTIRTIRTANTFMRRTMSSTMATMPKL